MSDQFLYCQALPTTLAGAGATKGDTTLILTNLTDPDENVLAMTDFGTIGFATIEPNSSENMESISFTGLTVNSNGTVSLTGICNITFTSPYTSTSGLSKTHAGGVVFVISNTAGFYDKITSKANDETVTGLWDFPSGANNPTIGNGTYVAPTEDTQIIPKKYADDLAIAGSPDMTLTVKGIGEEATAAEINAGTQTGGTSAELVVNPKYLKDSEYYTLRPTSDEKAALAGTGTPSGSNKYVTADTDALKEVLANKDTDGTLAANSDTKYPSQKAVKTYVDNSSPTVKNGNTTYDLSTDSGTQTIAHGLGKIPKFVRITAKYYSVSGLTFFSDSSGVYNGTTNSCVYSSWNTNGSQVASPIYGSNSTQIVHINQGISDNSTTQTGVATFDATNITITWTKAGLPSGTLQILWEAF